MSGAALLSRLAVRRGLTSAVAVRRLSTRLSSYTTPRLASAVTGGRLRECEGVSVWAGMRGLSTTSAVRSEASGGGVVAKLKIAIIGQSMFGKDVSSIINFWQGRLISNNSVLVFST